MLTKNGLSCNFKIDKVKVQKNGSSVHGYDISFKREYNGIPILYGESTDNGKKRYGTIYDGETIGMTIWNDTVIRFSWYNPVKLVEVKNANVGMLPFDKMMDIFKKQMALGYNITKFTPYGKSHPDYEKSVSGIQSVEVSIAYIKLGYLRISVQNNTVNYRLIPVWKFYGNHKTTMTQDIPDNEDKDDMPYMTLNALDGSRIDDDLGY